MTDYVTVSDALDEQTIKKSRFLTFVFRARSEEEGTARLAQLKKQYYDSSHVCYGAVYDPAGNLMRFSDDGEPSGTAGQPILEAIRKRELREVLVAVVRWFGGVKLGAGGLTRAYSDCASCALERAQKVRRVVCRFYAVQTDFALYRRLERALPAAGATVTDITYGEGVALTVAVPRGIDFEARLRDVSGGKVQPIFLKEDHCNFND